MSTENTTQNEQEKPAKKNQKKQNWKKLAKWAGIITAILILGYVTVLVFSPEKPKPQAIPTAKSPNIEELQAKLAKAEAEIAASKSKVAAAPVATPQVEVSEEDVSAKTTRVVEVKNYRRQNGGSVVRQIGKPITRNGKKFLPLFNDPKAPKGALTEPIDRDVADVQRNMTFDGVKPPSSGKLAVFDVVRNPETGALYNILAWEL